MKQWLQKVLCSHSEKGGIRHSNFWKTALLACLLGGVTFALFAPAIRYDFVNLDDELYVKDNPMVLQGLTVPGLRWAWCGVHENYWLPVLWLSYMLDTQLFGTSPSGYHFTNILLHALNTTLLFLLLARTTGRRWLSWFAAALFAWHPLRVESVAWITERKDVLSAWFGLLALWAYCRYAQGTEDRSQKTEVSSQQSAVRGQKSEVRSQKSEDRSQKSEVRGPSSDLRPLSSGFYWLGLILFVVGLMSKPMLVTLPFVLLLLDYWPLRRFERSTLNAQPSTLGRLMWEKWPWWGVAVVFSGITYYTQASTGAVISGEKLPVVERWLLVPLAYWFYVAKTFWPKGLAVVYPGLNLSWGGWVLAAVFLGAVTVAVVKARRRCAALPVGWLWFVVTLLPVIGLVRAGLVHLADRFTYLPSTGVGILVAWGLAELAAVGRHRRAVFVCAAVAMLTGCAATTWFQLKHWRNSMSLWSHAVAVTSDVPVSHQNLAKALSQQGRNEEAIVHHVEADRIFPGCAGVHYDWGNTLGQQSKFDEAIAHYAEAVKLEPNYAEAHFTWGSALVLQGKLEEAQTHLMEALRIKPGYVQARYKLGNLLVLRRRIDEALPHYFEAVKLGPQNAEAQYYLAGALALRKRVSEAATHFQAALKIKPDYAMAANDLAWILATETFRAVGPSGPEANGTLGMTNDKFGKTNAEFTSPFDNRDSTFRIAEAVRWAERACELTTNQEPGYLDTLGVAYSEAGRFQEAVAVTERAVARALAAGDKGMAARIESRLVHYRAGRAYHAMGAGTRDENH